MKLRIIHAAIAVAVLLACLWTFSFWLDAHDKHVYDDATQQVELNSLRKEVADLKDERTKIQQDTKQAVATEDSARQQATTAARQIEYVAIRAPGVSLRQNNTDPQAPTIEFPARQLPNLADYVNKSEDAKKELVGCKAEVANLDKQNADLTQQIAVAKPKTASLLARLRNFTMDGALAGAGGLGGALIAGPQGAAAGATGGFLLSKLIHH